MPKRITRPQTTAHQTSNQNQKHEFWYTQTADGIEPNPNAILPGCVDPEYITSLKSAYEFFKSMNVFLQSTNAPYRVGPSVTSEYICGLVLATGPIERIDPCTIGIYISEKQSTKSEQPIKSLTSAMSHLESIMEEN